MIKKGIIDTMNAEQKKRNLEKIKETNKMKMAERRKEAMSAVSLMSATYDRILSDEEKKNGLIIIRAFYGRSELVDEANEENAEILDVKIPLQCLVKDSRLILHESSKVSIS